MNRIISISTVAYDGYPIETAIEHIRKTGAKYVEIGFIKGYVEGFSEDLFNPDYAKEIKYLLNSYGLKTHVFSAHISLGTEDSVKRMFNRMKFALELGAKIVITNAALKHEGKQFFQNLSEIISYAEELGLLIALENPGDGIENLMNTGLEAIELVKKINSDRVGLNYDFGNLITHLNKKINPEDEAEEVSKYSFHLHLKDVTMDNSEWSFPGLGKGMINYEKIISQLIPETLPFSLEIPLRLRRKIDGTPYRLPEPIDIETIDRTIKESLEFVGECLK